MSEKTFTEMVEQNMRDITRMKQEAYQKGFTEGENRAISEFLEDYDTLPLQDMTDKHGAKRVVVDVWWIQKRREKWEKRAKE